MKRLERWLRHHRWNPIPCTCYECEIKKNLPQWAIDYLNWKKDQNDNDLR